MHALITHQAKLTSNYFVTLKLYMTTKSKIALRMIRKLATN